MSETPSEFPILHEALISFTGCIGNALEDICSYGLTIGEEYVPFDPDPEDDCEDEDVFCSQAWVRVANIVAVSNDSWEGTCSSVLRLTLEVGVLRCAPVEEGGEAPRAADVMVAALQAMTDMQAIQCAALGCEVWNSIDVGDWVPVGPLGGQVGGIWTFTVEI